MRSTYRSNLSGAGAAGLRNAAETAIRETDASLAMAVIQESQGVPKKNRPVNIHELANACLPDDVREIRDTLADARVTLDGAWWDHSFVRADSKPTKDAEYIRGAIDVVGVKNLKCWLACRDIDIDDTCDLLTEVYAHGADRDTVATLCGWGVDSPDGDGNGRIKELHECENIFIPRENPSAVAAHALTGRLAEISADVAARREAAEENVLEKVAEQTGFDLQVLREMYGPDLARSTT